MKKQLACKKKRKIALIVLSSIGSLFATSLLLAAFICTNDAPISNNEGGNAYAYAENGDRHINSYISDFNNDKEKTTSVYTQKYDNALEHTNRQYAYYQNASHYDEAVLTVNGDGQASLMVEDFLYDLAEQIDEFFKEIKEDRARVETNHYLKLETIKEAFGNDVEQIKSYIFDCEKQIAKLDIQDSNYSEKRSDIEYKIEIQHARLETLEQEYNYAIECENLEYNTNIQALDYAEAKINAFKEQISAENINVDASKIFYAEYESQNIDIKEQINEKIADLSDEIIPIDEIVEENCESINEVHTSNLYRNSNGGTSHNVVEQNNNDAGELDFSNSNVSYNLFNEPIILEEEPKEEELE